MRATGGWPALLRKTIHGRLHCKLAAIAKNGEERAIKRLPMFGAPRPNQLSFCSSPTGERRFDYLKNCHPDQVLENPANRAPVLDVGLGMEARVAIFSLRRRVRIRQSRAANRRLRGAGDAFARGFAFFCNRLEQLAANRHPDEPRFDQSDVFDCMVR